MVSGLERVLVVGGGVGGMATAIALRKQGLSVDLIDADPEWKVYGAGITITAPTLRAFRALGLFDAIGREGFFSVADRIYLHDGTLLTEMVTPPLEPGLPSSGGIMRPKLHQIMSSEVRAQGADVRLGVTADRLDEDDSGVSVTFSDGSTGRYDLVVGADGIYSRTRALLFGDAVRPVYTGQVCWRVVAPRPPEMNVTNFFFGHRNVAGVVPCSETQVYALILQPEPDPRRIPDDEKPALVRSLLKDFGGSIAVVRDGIGPHSSIIHRPFESVLLPKPWHCGRVLLIGDAAHATTPHLASGAGMAVEDALVLAEELSRGGDLSAALVRFTDRRYERCKFVVDRSLEIGKLELEGATPREIGMLTGQGLQRLAETI